MMTRDQVIRSFNLIYGKRGGSAEESEEHEHQAGFILLFGEKGEEDMVFLKEGSSDPDDELVRLCKRSGWVFKGDEETETYMLVESHQQTRTE